MQPPEPLTYGSVCSGIEGASVAWAPIGWRCAFMAEIEPFPRAVLKHHYPTTPLFSDFTQLRDHHPEVLAEADLLVGGTPCQGFSVAGLRGSLSDDRSNLCMEFIRLANAIDHLRCAAGRPPCWILWENVPGVFSTEDNAFGAFLGGLVGGDAALDAGPRGRWTDAGVVAGPDRVAAWRVLDAQHFGLAQRRRRVFVLAVGGAGAWRCADALLPLADSLQGYPAPRRQAREGTARPIAGGSPSSSGYRNDADTADNLIAPPLVGSDRGVARAGESRGQDPLVAFGGNRQSGEIDLATAVNAHGGPHGRQDFESETLLVAHSLRADGFDASEDGTGRGTPLIAAIAFNWQNGGGYGEANDGLGITEEGTGPLDASTVKAVAIPITADACRGEGAALTPSPDAAGRIRLRDPGLGIGADGDPAGTLAAAGPGAVFTLACRGRGDGHQLEFRDDELANAILTPNGGRAGIGVGAVAFDLVQLTHPENRSNPQPGDPAPTLASGGDPMVAFNITPSQGNIDYNARPTDRAQALTGSNGNRVSARGGDIVLGGSHGDAEEAGPHQTLRALREAVGEEAFLQWCLGVLAPFWPQEVLRSAVHGGSFRYPASLGRGVVSVALACTFTGRAWTVREVWEAGCSGCPPPGWEPSEQLAGELGAYLSELPQSPSPGERLVRDLWRAAEGSGLLREALSALQEVRRSTCSGDQPASGSAVRRLMVEECEALQGLPRSYTAVVFRGKAAADGPRYKALGNSFATPVLSWIGERIAAVR